MKMIELFNGSNKAKTGLLIGSVAIVSGLGSAILFNGFAHGEWDMLGLQQQVQYLTEKSDNHEARITNVENQANTPAGSPTPTPQVVTHVVTQPAPASVGTTTGSQPVEPAPVATPAPTPEPKVIRTVRVYCLDPKPQPYEVFKAILVYYSENDFKVTMPDGSPSTRTCQMGPGPTATW